MKIKFSLLLLIVCGSINIFAQRITSGAFHSIILCSDSSLMDFGNNLYGQIGDSTVINRTVPIQVHGVNNLGFFTNASDISGGSDHSLVLKNDSTVWAWGLNGDGELGDSTNINRYTLS